eukprot:2664381-Pyramimonas_sp.AAC.1
MGAMILRVSRRRRMTWMRVRRKRMSGRGRRARMRRKRAMRGGEGGWGCEGEGRRGKGQGIARIIARATEEANELQTAEATNSQPANERGS